MGREWPAPEKQTPPPHSPTIFPRPPCAMAAPLTNVARLVVAFSPVCPASRGARELLARASCARAAAAFPDAAVEARRDGAAGAPSVTVETSDKRTVVIEAGGMTAEALAARVAAAAVGRDAAGGAAAALKGAKLASEWGGGGFDAGSAAKVPVGG